MTISTIALNTGLQTQPIFVTAGYSVSATTAVGAGAYIEYSTSNRRHIIDGSAIWNKWIFGSVIVDTSDLVTADCYARMTASKPGPTMIIDSAPNNDIYGMQFKQKAATKSKTASYQYTVADFLIRFDATSGNLIGTLPTAASTFFAGMGQMFAIKKIDASGNSVTLKGSGNELIDGANSAAVGSQYACMMVQSNGVGYDIVSIS